MRGSTMARTLSSLTLRVPAGASSLGSSRLAGATGVATTAARSRRRSPRCASGGGVLEHPAHSAAWPAHEIDSPPRGGWQQSIDGSWGCEVSQVAYGNRARKRTWLYYVGANAPAALDWSEPEACAVVQTYTRGKPRAVVERQGTRERSASPVAFRDALLALARGAR
jgi:hypothetical protein